MIRLLADLLLPAYRFDRCALVEVYLRLAQLRNDLCGVCRFLFIESSCPLGQSDSHISWYNCRGSFQEEEVKYTVVARI